MSRVICRIPRAGLGNQLFVILKSIVFSGVHSVPLYFSHYNQLRIGPYLRRERVKRKYGGNFKFERGIFSDLCVRAAARAAPDSLLVYDAGINDPLDDSVAAYVFTEIPHYSDYFGELKCFRGVVREALLRWVSDEHLAALSEQPAPMVGVHVRLGDFKKLPEGADFRNFGATRTPVDYFINCIDKIRSICGRCLGVSVFSDGTEDELSELLGLPNTKLVSGNSDIVDLLLLSRSRVIVTSAGSTFSYWSSFLSDAAVVMHPDHIHESIRDEETNRLFFEGPIDEGGDLLRRNIRAIEC